MTPYEQLEHDLTDEARGRLKQWADDTLMRFKAAELDRDSKRLMFVALAAELLFVCLPRHLTKKEFLELMELMFDRTPKFSPRSPKHHA